MKHASLVALPIALALTATACSGSSSNPGVRAAASTASAPSSTRAVGPTALDLVQAEVQAFNRGDVSSAVALFTPDAVLVTALGGCDPCIGSATIRDHWSRAVASQTTISIEAPHQSGDIVTASSSLRAPSLPDGVQRAIGTLTATVSNDKITRWEQTYDLKDSQTAKLFAAVGLASSSSTATPQGAALPAALPSRATVVRRPEAPPGKR